MRISARKNVAHDKGRHFAWDRVINGITYRFVHVWGRSNGIESLSVNREDPETWTQVHYFERHPTV